MKRNDYKKSYKRYKISLLYSFRMIIPFSLVILTGISQAFYNLNTYDYSSNRLGTFREYIQYEQGTYSLYFDTNELYKIFGRYIMEKAEYTPLFTGFMPKGFSFEELYIELTQERETKLNVVYNAMYAYDGLETNLALDMINKPPCLELKKKNINPPPLEEKFVNQDFCEILADGLTKSSFLKSFMWLRTQERLIKAKIDRTSGEDLYKIFSTKRYLDYEMYVRFVLNEYLEVYNDKFEGDLNVFSQEVNDTIQVLSLYGVVFSMLIVIVVYWNYHARSSQLFSKSMYIVKLIPYQTLSENTYVKSRLLKILGLNSY